MEIKSENFELTQEVFDETQISQEPDMCPICGSNNLTYDVLEYSDADVCGTVSCDDCHVDWDQIYSFKENVL